MNPEITSEEKKQLESVVFDATFTEDSGDENPPHVDTMINSFNDGEGAKNSNGASIDYTSAMMGFWSFIDLIMVVISKSTKGTLEYEKMDHGALHSLSLQSAQSPHFQKLAVMENAPTWLVVANAVGQFGSRIKYNPKKEESKKSELKSGISDEDKIMLRKLIQTPKISKVEKSNLPKSSLVEDRLTQGDLVKMLDNPDLSEDDRKTLKQLVNASELSPENFTRNRFFSKSRSEEIREEELKAKKRAGSSPVGYKK